MQGLQRKKPEAVEVWSPPSPELARRNTLARHELMEVESFLAGHVMHEVERLGKDAMIGDAMLSRFADVMAGFDPHLREELRQTTAMIRQAQGHIIARFVDDCARPR
jgi:hypothetical protein